MSRSWRRLLVVGLIVLALGLTAWFAFVGPLYLHGRWYREVRASILALAQKRPPDVSKGQWEFAVGWTVNLHGNCGSIYGTVDPGWQKQFAAELQERLQGPMSLADIEWIWDEYARSTKYGHTYSDRWRPTRAEEFSQAAEGCFGIPVD